MSDPRWVSGRYMDFYAMKQADSNYAVPQTVAQANADQRNAWGAVDSGLSFVDVGIEDGVNFDQHHADLVQRTSNGVTFTMARVWRLPMEKLRRRNRPSSSIGARARDS